MSHYVMMSAYEAKRCAVPMLWLAFYTKTAVAAKLEPGGHAVVRPISYGEDPDKFYLKIAASVQHGVKLQPKTKRDWVELRMRLSSCGIPEHVRFEARRFPARLGKTGRGLIVGPIEF